MANRVVRLTGGTILLVLTWYSLRFTQYMLPVPGYEYPVDKKDSLWVNLLSVVILVTLLAGGYFLERKLKPKTQQMIGRIVLVFSMLWQGIWGWLWIFAAKRPPSADQGFIMDAAKGFIAGDYGSLGPYGYCEIYPHQLGLVFLEEVVFRLTGNTEYYWIQLLYVLMLPGIVYFVYGILKECSGHSTILVMGTLLTGACVAPVFYSSWLYGEIPYVFFATLAAWMLVRYAKRGQSGSLVGFMAAVTFAMLVRKNALILIVAFCLAGAVTAFAQKNRKLVVVIVLAMLIPNLCYSGIFKMYEQRSGFEHAEGLPTNGYIYIGLQETEGRYGWDFWESSAAYYDNDRDTGRAKEAFSQMNRVRLQEMKANPEYAFLFFKGKILSQWNAPLYQAVYFGSGHQEARSESLTAFFDRFSNEWFENVLWWMDRLQFVIYLGVLLYFVLRVKPDSNLLEHLLAVTIIGGFLFSIIWEAKTRYIFPYYMMMFPLAGLGYEELMRCMEKFKRYFEGKISGKNK